MTDENKTLKELFLESCHGNKVERVEACLDFDMNVNTVSDDGLWSGLAICAKNNYLQLLDTLLLCDVIDVNLSTSLLFNV